MKVTKIDSKDIVDLIRTFAMENPHFSCIQGSIHCKGNVIEYKIKNKDKRFERICSTGEARVWRINYNLRVNMKDKTKAKLLIIALIVGTVLGSYTNWLMLTRL